jgi:hypothetical protein
MRKRIVRERISVTAADALADRRDHRDENVATDESASPDS